MKKTTLFLALFLSIQVFSQELTGKQLLEKAINYHDPNGNWDTFEGELYVSMISPTKPERKSHIKINLPEEYFYVKATRDMIISEYTIDKDKCVIALNGKENPSDAEKKEHELSCERARMYKNYYTFLYGLPMKLKDNGTIVHEKVERKTFKGKEYLVLKVTYSEEVGKDTWYFYFNPKTYALEVYQFFKDTKKSGEYILLSGLENINGIKMPKNRAWYYNKNNKYLGTDYLKLKI